MDVAKVVVYSVALLFIFGGIYTIVATSSLGPLGLVGVVFGVLLVGIGFKIIVKARSLRSFSGARRLAAVVLAAAVAASSVASAQTTVHPHYTKECVDAYRRTVYFEYVTLAILFASAFATTISIVFGHTRYGSFLQEFSAVFVAALVISGVMAATFVGVDVGYVFKEGQSRCYFDIHRVAKYGPPIARVLLNMLLPPMPETWSSGGTP